MTTATEKFKKREEQDDVERTMNLLFNKDCHRCGGLMVTDLCFDVESTTGEFEIEIRKCLSCGETIDPTILMNRQRNAQNLQEHAQIELHFPKPRRLPLNH